MSEPEQAVFRRLSVFAGGWTVPASGASCGLTDEIAFDLALDLLARLVTRTLVQVESVPNPVVRNSLLETIRECVLEQLRASGEEAALRQRHAVYSLALAKEEPELWGARPERWLRRLELDRPIDPTVRASGCSIAGGGFGAVGLLLGMGALIPGICEAEMLAVALAMAGAAFGVVALAVSLGCP